MQVRRDSFDLSVRDLWAKEVHAADRMNALAVEPLGVGGAADGRHLLQRGFVVSRKKRDHQDGGVNRCEHPQECATIPTLWSGWSVRWRGWWCGDHELKASENLGCFASNASRRWNGSASSREFRSRWAFCSRVQFDGDPICICASESGASQSDSSDLA